jgi:hypothetical protein
MALDRPALNRMRADLKTDRFDGIYFLAGDRIAGEVEYQSIIVGILAEIQLAILCEVIGLQNIMPANRAGMILVRRQQGYGYSCVTNSPARCTTILTPDCISGVAPFLRRTWATSPLYLRGI